MGTAGQKGCSPSVLLPHLLLPARPSPSPHCAPVLSSLDASPSRPSARSSSFYSVSAAQLACLSLFSCLCLSPTELELSDKRKMIPSCQGY